LIKVRLRYGYAKWKFRVRFRFSLQKLCSQSIQHERSFWSN